MLLTSLLLAALPATAQGTLLEYKAWVLGCDNTLRCEAQGYHEGEVPPAAIRVLRDAGPDAPVRLVLAFGVMGNESPSPRPELPVQLAVGPLRLALPPPGTNPFTEVPAAQVPRLLPWLKKADALRLASGASHWTVSLAGASAALLKMDELQGRVGKPVAPPPVPALVAMRVPAAQPGDDALAAQVRPLVARSADTCPLMEDASVRAEVFRVEPGRVMLVWDCWMGAYQGGRAAWVANDRPPFAPERVVFQAPGPEANDEPANLELAVDASGRLQARASGKGRGIGDCVSERRWAWDGRRFALIDATESPCRLFEFQGLPITLWRAVLR